MFQLDAVAVEDVRPCLAHGFDFKRALRLVVQFAGFLGQAVGGQAAGGHQDMGVNIPRVVAAPGRVEGRIGGALVSADQPQAKRLCGLPLAV